MYNIIHLLLLLFLFACGKNGNQKILGPDEVQVKQTSFQKSFPVISNQDQLLSLDGQQQLPNPLSSSYYQVNITHEETKSLNYQSFPKGTKKIHLKGKTIELQNTQNGPQSELYHLLKDTYDVSNVVIEADEVYIYDPLRLRHASVEIRARRLVFARKGRINITPISLSSSAPQFQDGKDGLNAGKIKLFIDEFYGGYPDYPVLIANGGNGQAAGPGINGARGTDAKIVHGENHYQYREEICHLDPEPRPGRYLIPKYGRYCEWSRAKIGRAASNGKDAKVGGMPGAPGNAGIIISTLQVPYQLLGGIAGKQDSLREGGAPGNPITSCKYDKGDRSRSKTYDCVNVKKGKDARPKRQLIAKGNPGGMELVKDDWMNDGYILNHLAYAKDIYIANNPQLALKEFSLLAEKLKKSNHKSVISMKAYSDISSLTSQIKMHLDYFGNPIGWVPNFNLGITYSLYEEEVRRNIALIFKTKTLIKKIQNQQNTQRELESLRKDAVESIEDKSKQINQISSLHVNLQQELENLEISQEEFEFELKKLEEEIKKMAKRNLKVPFMEKAVRFFAVASKAIPVGQPSFAAAGIGLEFLYDSMNGDRNAFDILTQVPNVASEFKEFDWSEASNKLKTSIDKMGIESLKEKLAQARNAKERRAIKIEHLEEIQNFTTGIYKKISIEMNRWKQRETNQNALEAEIAKIKNSHPVYGKTVDKLEKLLYEKQTFMVQINQFQVQMSDIARAIEADYILLANITEDYNSNMQSSLSEFENHLKLVYRRAYDRIRYYRYLLAKSYSYRLMKQYPISYDATSFINKFEQTLTNSSEFSESKVEEVFVLFENELSEIVASMIIDIEDRGTARTLSKEYLLTESELEKLNRGEEVFLDFTQSDFYGKNKEDLRLLNIELLDCFEVQGDKNGEFELIFSHVGKSLLRKNGQDYLFLHDKGEKQGQFKWSSYYSFYSNSLHSSKVDLSSDSLLFILLDRNHDRNITSHIRPGARSFIRAKLEKSKDTKIANAIVKINYSFRDY